MAENCKPTSTCVTTLMEHMNLSKQLTAVQADSPSATEVTQIHRGWIHRLRIHATAELAVEHPRRRERRVALAQPGGAGVLLEGHPAATDHAEILGGERIGAELPSLHRAHAAEFRRPGDAGHLVDKHITTDHLETKKNLYFDNDSK